MVRCLRSGEDEGLEFHLNIEFHDRSSSLGKWSGLDQRQRLCVKRFLSLMLAITDHTAEKRGLSERDPVRTEATQGWRDALASYWEGVAEGVV